MESTNVPSTSYERPMIVDFGDLVELTAGTSSGEYLDADFPAGTKSSSLTFSSQ